MTIPEEQLKTWSNPGGTANSITAHTAIRNALEAADSPVKDKKPEIFLQGSYRNSTNIRADSDVDVVAQLNHIWYDDLSGLKPEEKATYERTFVKSNYGAADWRKDVEQALRKKFGTALKSVGSKAFHVVTGPGNMTADVLPAIQFKKYNFFLSRGVEDFDEGVEFADAAGTLTINYPKLHIRNGEDKNSDARTKGWYKSSVRMFKNARNAVRQLPDVRRHTLSNVSCTTYLTGTSVARFSRPITTWSGISTTIQSVISDVRTARYPCSG